MWRLKLGLVDMKDVEWEYSSKQSVSDSTCYSKVAKAKFW